MRTVGTHHLAISTPHFARLRDFYVETLGLAVLGEFAGHDIVFIDAGGTTIELIGESNPPGGVGGSGWQHLAWEVENLDRTYAELLALGIQFHVPPEDFPPTAPSMRIAFFKDPDGNVLELVQPLGSRYPSARSASTAVGVADAHCATWPRWSATGTTRAQIANTAGAVRPPASRRRITKEAAVARRVDDEIAARAYPDDVAAGAYADDVTSRVYPNDVTSRAYPDDAAHHAPTVRLRRPTTETWLWIIGGVAALALLLSLYSLFLSLRAEAQVGDGRTGTGFGVSEIADNPTDYFGRDVTVLGEVGDSVNANAFILVEDGIFDSDEVLVLAAAPFPVAQGRSEIQPFIRSDVVQVQGTVRPFDRVAFERELGYQLNDAAFDDWVDKPAIIARSVSMAR